MDQNEVIILSSDDEAEAKDGVEENFNTNTSIKTECKNLLGNNKKCARKFNKIDNATNTKNEVRISEEPVVLVKHFKESNKSSPEIVDLVDFSDKVDAELSQKSSQNDKEWDFINIDETPNNNGSSSVKEIISDEIKNKNSCKSLLSNKTEKNQEKITNDFIGSTPNSYNNFNENEESNQNLKFFTEFVEQCGSLENIQNDRVRLTRKLMKKYGEADCNYIKSQEFRYLIEKCKEKVNKNNLYLIAKEITEELIYRRKITVNRRKKNPGEEENQRETHESSEEKHSLKETKRRVKFINKIIKKLDKLGSKIRELEVQEVDLSDEEESSYVMLQRYRERFCQIYKKLCAYTNEIRDPNNRRICFTESKYPAINKCIENWLNKTKRFPDFKDIMKLLENQSSSLGLPSNKESVRAIAVEIFQKVGAMLQRRRIYDLWDTFCGFLDDGNDPAASNPILDEILKRNFEIRLKKEQEIFQHFAELQEKEKLEPEEVADEEANHSPVESGNDDEREIEDIENCLNKRLDDAIKETEDNGNNILETKDYDEDGNSGNEAEDQKLKSIKRTIETKNNYRNCKSLKWRSKNRGKAKLEISKSEDSSAGMEKEKEKSENGVEGAKDVAVTKEMLRDSEEVEKDDSDLELIAVETVDLAARERNNEAKTKDRCGISCKRVSRMEIKDPVPKMRKCGNKAEKKKKDFDVYEFYEEIEKGMGGETNEVFRIHCCQIFSDSVFEGMIREQKNWKKRKVFRDLTNVNRLMELHGKGKKTSGLFSPLFLHGNFSDFEKSTWKKRFKLSYQLATAKNQKSGLNGKENGEKTVTSDFGGDIDEKDIQSASERGEDDKGDIFFSRLGDGNEEDDSEDENKTRGKTEEDEINEREREGKENEEEDENENKNADDNIKNTEATKHYFFIQKTEKPSAVILGNTTPLDIEYNFSKSKGIIELHMTESESPIPELSLENDKTLESINEMQHKTQTERVTSIRSMVNKAKNESRKVPENKNKTDEEKNVEIKSKGNTVRGQCRKHKSEIKGRKRKKTVKKSKADAKETKKKRKDYELTPDKKQKVERRLGMNYLRTAMTSAESRTCLGCIIPKAPQQIINNKIEKHKGSTTTLEECQKAYQLDFRSKNLCRTIAPSMSDEDRVNRFLKHSPSSISITPPKNLGFSKPPSQAILKALATLRNLKDISATIVQITPSNKDDVEDTSSCKKRTKQYSNHPKRKRSAFSEISSVESMAPNFKIDTVQKNVFGNEHSFWDSENSQCESNSIRISSVWGNLPSNFGESPKKETGDPGCSCQQNKAVEKNSNKMIEYVLLE